MKIENFGQSCFRITAKNGTRVLTDPFGNIGYTMPKVEADIVTKSHDHFDHNNVGAVKGPFKLLGEPGETEAGGVTFRGIATFHDSVGGSKRGPNVVFPISADALTLCHVGDLGHLLTEEQLKSVGRVDILLVPVGEVFTFPVEDAMKLVEQLDPVVVLPMHYKMSGVMQKLLPLATPEKFLRLTGDRKIAHLDELDLTPEKIEEYRGFVLLNRKTEG